MISHSIAILIYGYTNSGRNALVEEKYKDLASAFATQGFNVHSVLYNDEAAEKLATDLLSFDAVLVWVNPVEQGNDRKKLDAMLTEIAGKGCFVSTHPDVILKMGTKEVLYTTREMDWGGDVKMYNSHEDFINRFPASLQQSKIRILKKYRGNGGDGVYKVTMGSSGKDITIIHAIAPHEERVLSLTDFYNEFKLFFLANELLIDQAWNASISNGMVRCYVSGTTVAGFGYQEINALYGTDSKTPAPASKRYYFTENCALFHDLRMIMENDWIPELQNRLSITENRMPVIWDADFFINTINRNTVAGKYTLCEINVSCVSPFPPSAIPFIVDEVKKRTNKQK